MNNQLYEALSVCLSEMQAGTDIETCLARYPHLAADLRPLLVTAARASSAAVNDIPADVMRRARARVLDAAAEMRQQPAAPAPRLRWPKFHWSARLARLAIVTLVILAFMVTGGTGLVSASNGALPGDQLYPIKRGLEGLRLLLALDPAVRQALEESLEEERLEEIGELFTIGRESEVEFYGYVTARTDTGWIVNQVMVQVTPQTRIDGPLGLGAYVEVKGQTSAGGLVIAERVRVRKGGEGEQEQDEGDSSTISAPESQQGASSSSETKSSQPGKTPEPTRAPESARFEFEGVIQSIQGDTWRVSGQSISVRGAEIDGKPSIGALVRVKGTITNGMWTASEVKVRSSSGGSSASTSGSGSSAPGGSGGSSSGSGSGASSSSSSTGSDDDHGGSSSSSSSKSDDDD